MYECLLLYYINQKQTDIRNLLHTFVIIFNIRIRVINYVISFFKKYLQIELIIS